MSLRRILNVAHYCLTDGMDRAAVETFDRALAGDEGAPVKRSRQTQQELMQAMRLGGAG